MEDKKYIATIGTPTRYESGLPAPMRIEEYEVDSLGIDNLLALQISELIESSIDALLGTPGFLWDDETETSTLLQDSLSLRKIKSEYLTSIVSIALGTLRSEGCVLVNLKTLTVMCTHDLEQMSELFFAIELLES